MRRVSLAFFALIMILLAVVPATIYASTAEQACGPNVVHVVAAGENLFRISLRYGTTMSAIASANGIANIHRIFAGQRLLIPCAGAAGGFGNSNFVQPVVIVPPAIAQPLAQVFVGAEDHPPFVAPLTADCSRFRPTSPLDGLANGSNVFYWDPAPGATSYRVNIYNLSIAGAPLMASYEVSGLLTHLQGDAGDGAVGGGFLFRWEAQALVSDQVACSTSVTVPRAVAATPVPTIAPTLPAP
jgi:LysM repeat protein